jgi:DNA repair protein RadA/Sms
MAKVRAVHTCSACGATSSQWSGKCGGCGEWNTLSEEAAPTVAPAAARHAAAVAPLVRPVSINDVDQAGWAPAPTGVLEVDRVLGGGVVPGSVTLLGGEPGIGKSTLLLQLLAKLANGGSSCLLVSAEESAQQVRLRAERLDALSPNLFIVAETALPNVLGAIDHLKPAFVAVDSIQTVFDPELGAQPGTVTQVRECAGALVQRAKQNGPAVWLVGHVTKDGQLAGPRQLEHLVDTVLSFEGDRHHGLRMLRAVKHRFGSTEELGLFDMQGEGLTEVPDPSGLLLADRNDTVSGSIVTAAMDGYRPLLVEVQALVGTEESVPARRSAQGLDTNRLNLLVAVLERHTGMSVLGKRNVYGSAVGGIRVVEPAADLAIAIAIASTHKNRVVAPDLVACGEVGLGGEIRQVSHMGRRLAEAARLGFKAAVVPMSCPDGPKGLELIRVKDVTTAISRTVSQ